MSDSTTRFGDRAAAYAAHRPGYPIEAIDAVLEGLGDLRKTIVADIGAGTGISSRALAARGVGVIAIEPNEAMRERAEAHAGIEWREGTADSTGLADRSVDAAVVFQAFHWFANDRAMAEMRRIARRRAALVQYERDERAEFTRAYGEIMRRYATDDTEALRMRALEIFSSFPNAKVTRREYGFAQDFDGAGLLGRAASASYLPREGAPAESLRAELVALFARFARGGSVTLVSRVFVMRADWA